MARRFIAIPPRSPAAGGSTSASSCAQVRVALGLPRRASCSCAGATGSKSSTTVEKSPRPVSKTVRAAWNISVLCGRSHRDSSRHLRLAEARHAASAARPRRAPRPGPAATSARAMRGLVLGGMHARLLAARHARPAAPLRRRKRHQRIERPARTVTHPGVEFGPAPRDARPRCAVRPPSTAARRSPSPERSPPPGRPSTRGCVDRGKRVHDPRWVPAGRSSRRFSSASRRLALGREILRDARRAAPVRAGRGFAASISALPAA